MTLLVRLTAHSTVCHICETDIDIRVDPEVVQVSIREGVEHSIGAIQIQVHEAIVGRQGGVHEAPVGRQGEVPEGIIAI